MLSSAAMQYHFGDFVLDPGKFELRRNGVMLPAEPQVLSMLLMLVENGERLVSKHELVESIWDGRAVSDSAISSRVKTARQLLGDDGSAQRFIRTVHGKGYRFVGEVQARVAAEARHPPDEREAGRPSIAVLPFNNAHGAEVSVISDGLPHELIVELSRLRWITVIARGSAFRFRGSKLDLGQVRAILGVRYCLTGNVDVVGERIGVAVELVDTCSDAIVWAEHFEGSLHDLHEIRETIVARVIGSLEIQIPLHEAERARLFAPEDMDAWSSYHLGLQHMLRFNKADNLLALSHFERAACLEPGFARAYAGLSFTRFQNAFLNYADAPAVEAALARRAAEKAIELDELDPFANLTMGRAHWLNHQVESSIPWLERATRLSPNYAHAIYSQAWAKMVLGEAADGQRNAKEAMRLSPIDPLKYAMVATDALAELMLDRQESAAALADQAAREPRAHVLIAVIAAACQKLAGNSGRAAYWAADVKSRAPQLTQSDFFRSFPFTDPALRNRLSAGLSQIGI